MTYNNDMVAILLKMGICKESSDWGE